MQNLDLEAWRKPSLDSQSEPINNIRFYVDQETHIKLEKAEEEIANSDIQEKFVDANEGTLELSSPDAISKLKDIQFRVYRDNTFDRGQFHLVAKDSANNDIIYTNAVMVDQLG